MMPLATIKLLTHDKLPTIRQLVDDYVAALSPGQVVVCSPLSVYQQNDGDTRFVIAIGHHEPGAVDEDTGVRICDRDKVEKIQDDIDDLLAQVVHQTSVANTTVAFTVTAVDPIFEAEDVGRLIASGGEQRTISAFTSPTEVDYTGDPLPAGAMVNVSLLGAEALRDVSLDTWLRKDRDTRVALSFKAGSILSPGAAAGGGTTLNTIEVTNNYTVQPGIDFVAVDASAGPVNITMPPAADGERKIHVKKIDASANKVTVLPDGADTVDSYTGFDILFQNNSYIFVSNDVDTWWVT